MMSVSELQAAHERHRELVTEDPALWQLGEAVVELARRWARRTLPLRSRPRPARRPLAAIGHRNGRRGITWIWRSRAPRPVVFLQQHPSHAHNNRTPAEHPNEARTG